MTARLPRFVILAFMLAGLAGCDAVVATPGAASQDAPKNIRNDDAYSLAPADVVKITVYNEETLTGQYTIDRNGNITMPLLGQVQAGGLPKESLQKEISTALKSGGYIQKPLVTVDVVSVRPFYIVGEVKNPGSYPWAPSMDALKAVATAGGYTPRAATGRLLIDRGEGEHKQHLNGTEDTPILPGDSITVRERIF